MCVKLFKAYQSCAEDNQADAVSNMEDCRSKDAQRMSIVNDVPHCIVLVVYKGLCSNSKPHSQDSHRQPDGNSDA